jgi:4-diphosphocytidyl-2-C-methyl-D-erythritol kinase
LPDAPPLWFVIVKPEDGVSTASAYGLLDEIPDRISSRSTRAMEELLARGELDRITARMTNDFEAALLPQRIDLAALHDDLLMARARAVRLCGSGSAAFGVAWSRPEADEIARLMRLKYGLVFVCRSVTRDESLALGYAS